MSTTMRLGLIALLICGVGSVEYVPLVLMHGITATTSSMDFIKQYVQKAMPGIYVYELYVGENTPEASVFLNMNLQVEQMNQQLANNTNLTRGFNLMGVSQGGQNTRGWIERYNNPPVLNYIAWVSVQAGVFGIPEGGFINPTVDRLLRDLPYDAVVQNNIAPADYWKDPYQLETYLEKSTFLADLNNERPEKNPLYKENILKLQKYLMLYSEVDEVLIPRETGWFWFYANNSDTEVIPLNQTDMWKDDWIGIRTLEETGRLLYGTTQCEHGDYSSACFVKYFEQYVMPIISVPFPEAGPTHDTALHEAPPQQ